MLTAIFSALAALPGIFGYIEKFSAWLSSQVDSYKAEQAKKAMDKATTGAKETKDTSEMDNLFGGK